MNKYLVNYAPLVSVVVWLAPNMDPHPGEPINVDPDPKHWVGATSHNGEKALSCINHSILSGRGGLSKQKLYSYLWLRVLPFSCVVNWLKNIS